MTIAESWRAELELTFAARDGHTYLAHRRHQGPLLVQRPFHPEGPVCHAYLVHPPGGVVGGDQLQLRVQVEQGAHALLTTPAAGKFYRSDGRVAALEQTLTVTDATLEWLPQEAIYFPAANARARTQVRLSGSARFLGWEIACLGLPAREERFTAGNLSLGFELWNEQGACLMDRLRIQGGSPSLQSRYGFAGYEAVGTFIVSPAQSAWVELLRAIPTEACEVGVTLVDGVLVGRVLAMRGEAIKQIFLHWWHTLRPIALGRHAVPPRIWAT
jgi:urease accessory protein